METKPAFSAAVVEVLKQDNYLDWSVRVKTSLMAQGLWDIVESRSGSPTPENVAVLNAMALHVIQNSCGPDTFSDIREITSARIAWETLEGKYKPKGPDPRSGMASVPLEEGKLDSSIKPGESDKEGNIDDGVEIYMDLYKALQIGDWNAANEFFKRQPHAISAKITVSDKTALHVAAEAGHVHIVEELVKQMSEENLEIRDNEGFTALALATCNGDYRVAECMLGKNENLISIREKNGNIPVVLALYNGHLKLARYLYLLTPLEILKPENGTMGATVVCEAIYNKALDIALDLVNRCPRLVVAQDGFGNSPCYALACMPHYFPSPDPLVFWKQWIYSDIHIQLGGPINDICLNIQKLAGNGSLNNGKEIIGSGPINETRLNIQKLAGNRSNDNETSGLGLSSLSRLVSNLQTFFGIKHLYEMKLTHFLSRELLSLMRDQISISNIQQREIGRVRDAIIRATKEGSFEFVFEIVKSNPQLVWIHDEKSSSIFSVAVQYRQAKIFSLIYGLNMKKSLVSGTDSFYDNNLLHMAGMVEYSTLHKRIPGAALLMQRELQWFQEVESIAHAKVRVSLNKEGLTPRQLFTKNHEDMMSKGEKWMKDTVSSCMVVGALVVTIMFTVAFTVPGGNDQNKGFPIFLNEKLFMVFIVSVALSLFFSSTSVLTFLGIFTSRYAQEDFLKSLPTKLIIGFSTLLFSILAMITAFSAALLLMLRGQSWILLPIIFLASIPVTLIALMQFPLLVSMANSTYGPSIFDRKMKRRL